MKIIDPGRQKMLWRYTDYLGLILEDLREVYNHLCTNLCV